MTTKDFAVTKGTAGNSPVGVKSLRRRGLTRVTRTWVVMSN